MGSNVRESKRRKAAMRFLLTDTPYSTSANEEPLSPHNKQIACISVTQQRFPCPACGKSFQRMSHLRRHARDTKNEAHRASWPMLNRTQCLSCRKGFKNSAGLKKHKKAPCQPGAFINISALQEELVEPKRVNITWEEDSLDNQNKESKGARQPFASNDKLIQGEMEGKSRYATACSLQGQDQFMVANTIPWATEAWNGATYLHPLKGQGEFTTTTPLTAEYWDNAEYQSTTANTIPWATRDWEYEAYLSLLKEQAQYTMATTIPWATGDWDDTRYQSTHTNTVPWATEDWDNTAHQPATMNAVPWATEDWDNAAFQPATASTILEASEEWGLLGLQGQTRETNTTETNLLQQRVDSRNSFSQSWSMLRAGTDNHTVVDQN